MQYAHAIFVWSFFIFSRSISCSMFYFHVLTLLNFEFWISDRSKPHLESALYYRGNSNHSCSLSFSLVSRISPPEIKFRAGILDFLNFLIIFSIFYTNIFTIKFWLSWWWSQGRLRSTHNGELGVWNCPGHYSDSNNAFILLWFWFFTPADSLELPRIPRITGLFDGGNVFC